MTNEIETPKTSESLPPTNPKVNRIWQISLIVTIVIAFVYLYISLRSDVPIPSTEDFVKCLNATGAVMYGTSWCHYCQQQKTVLAPYFEYITFVDCDENKEVCTANGITGYPSWVIRGMKYSGMHTIKQLSDISGCKI